MRYIPLLLLVMIVSYASCQEKAYRPLPVIKEAIEDFSVVNQEGDTLTKADFEGKIYVADFFFSRCPTQCPKMKRQMMRIYKKFIENEDVVFLSHSIDTRNDSVPVLKDYADKLGVAAPKWQFVTTSREEIQILAREYFSAVQEDENAPGGYLHSTRFLVIDWKGRMRAQCDGQEEEKVTEMMEDIENLLNERAKEENAEKD